MKKITAILLTLVMVLATFSFTVMAEGENANLAQGEKNYAYGKSYAYAEEYAYLAGTADDGKILTDGVLPYAEEGGKSVGITGTAKVVTLTIDLGKSYSDISKVIINVRDSDAFEAGNRGFCRDKARIETSTNGSDFKVAKYTMEKEVWAEGDDMGYYNYIYNFSSDLKARYVKLTVYSNKWVLLMNEIQVVGGEAIVTEESSEAPVVSEESSEEVSEEASEDGSEAPVVPADPFDGKYFVVASAEGKIWAVENDFVTAVPVTEETKLLSELVWKFELKEDGKYKISNKATGKVLDIEDGLDADGTNVKAWDSNDSAAQRYGVTLIQDASDPETSISGYAVSIFPACSATRAIVVNPETSAVQIATYDVTNPTAFVIVLVQVTEDMLEDPVEVNYAAGKKYTIEGALKYLDASKTDNGEMLTDGIIPTSETPFETVAFAGSKVTNTITINLGKKCTDINKIRFDGVVINGNRQFADVIIEVSNNGSSFTKLSADDYTYAEVETEVANTFNIEYALAKDVTAKYVRVTLTSKEYVLTLGEIEVIGGGASGGAVNPDENENPGDAGFAVVALVAAISLAGAVIVSRRKFN